MNNNNRLAQLRALSLCFAVCCIACTDAVACAVYGTGHSIVFKQAPNDIRFYSSEVIETTILDSTLVHDGVGRPMTLVNAHVDRVIKGSIHAETVKILFYQTTCITLAGGHGIILGEIEQDPLHGLVLIPKRHGLAEAL